VRVRVVTLDSFEGIARIQHLRLVKIDAEGHDLQVNPKP
jgi:hypothetical protein